jgi:hypothetical protein
MAQDNVICTLNLSEYTPISVEGSAVPDSVMRLTMFIQKSLYQDATQSQRAVSTFAIPVSSKEGISWHIPKVFGTKFLVEPLESLSEDEQVFYLLEVCRVIKELKDRCQKILSDNSSVFSEKILARFFYDNESPDHLGAALYIPDTSHIYIVNDRPLIVGWGFQKKSANWKRDRCNIYKVVEQASDQDFFDTLEYFSYVMRPPVLTKESEEKILKRIAAKKSKSETAIASSAPSSAPQQDKSPQDTVTPKAQAVPRKEAGNVPSSPHPDSAPAQAKPESDHQSAEILNLTSTLDRKKVANKIKEQGMTADELPAIAAKTPETSSGKLPAVKGEDPEDPPVDEHLINSALEAEKLVQRNKEQEVIAASLPPDSDSNYRSAGGRLKAIATVILIIGAAAGLGLVSYLYFGNNDADPENNNTAANTKITPKTEVIAKTKESIADYKPEMRSIIIPFKKMPDIGYDKGDGPTRITHIISAQKP